jgi:hypothetical protein
MSSEDNIPSQHTVSNEILREFEHNMDAGKVSDNIWSVIEEKFPKMDVNSLKNDKNTFSNLSPTKREREVINFAKDNTDPVNVVLRMRIFSETERDIHLFLMTMKNVDPKLRKESHTPDPDKYGIIVTYSLFFELWKLDIVEYLVNFYPELSTGYKIWLLRDILKKDIDISVYHLSKLIKMWKMEKEFTREVLTIVDINHLTGELDYYEALDFSELNIIMENAFYNNGFDLLFFVSNVFRENFEEFMSKEGRLQSMYQKLTKYASEEEMENYEKWFMAHSDIF